MKKLMMILAFCFSISAYAKDPGTWTGYISDSHCGADGAKAGHVDCARKCIKGGASAVFVVDGKVYKINDAGKVSKYIGQKVSIKGTISGDAISIDKISKQS